jgi:nitrate reductase NapD
LFADVPRTGPAEKKKMNISSVIVIPRPERVAAVTEGLRQIEGVDVAAVSPEGKIIVTLETEGDGETVAMYEGISLMDGVMSASMVYHHKEDEPEVEISVEA